MAYVICSIKLILIPSVPMLIASAILSCTAFIFNWSFRIPKYLFFFILGIYIRDHYDKFTEIRKNKLIFILLAISIGNSTERLSKINAITDTQKRVYKNHIVVFGLSPRINFHLKKTKVQDRKSVV